MNQSSTITAVIDPPTASTCAPKQTDIFEDGFVKLAPRTHDIAFTEAHLPGIARLGADLDAAVNAVWRQQSRYSRVYALLLSWEEDDLGVSREIKCLRHVLRDRFHFQVEDYRIPSVKPDKALTRRILDFLDLDGKDTLLIVYYGGHARKAMHSNEAPIWFANRVNLNISLPSGGIQHKFEEADADALLLFDCCHSAATATKDSQQGNVGVTEVIAACGYETIAPEVDQHSFTKALTEILALASKGSAFSVGELHSRILARLKCWTPSLLNDEEGKFLETPDGRLAWERQPRRTPIYSVINECHPRRSIVLAPLVSANVSSSSTSTREDADGSSPSSSDHITPASSQSDNGSRSPARKRKRSSEDTSLYPQILLAIRLEKEEIDREAWVDWIRNLPDDGIGIHVEGKYDSFSTLLLMRMPVAVWNLLPDDPAYSFVGFVTSENSIATAAGFLSAVQQVKEEARMNRLKGTEATNDPSAPFKAKQEYFSTEDYNAVLGSTSLSKQVKDYNALEHQSGKHLAGPENIAATSYSQTKRPLIESNKSTIQKVKEYRPNEGYLTPHLAPARVPSTSSFDDSAIGDPAYTYAPRARRPQHCCANCQKLSLIGESWACTECLSGFCNDCRDIFMAIQGEKRKCPRCGTIGARFERFQLDFRR